MSYNPYSDNNTIFSGGGVTFTWFDGDPAAGGTLIPASPPPCIDFTSPPTPNLHVTISDGSCSSTFPITISLVGPPTINVPPLPPLCSNIPFLNLTLFNSIISSDPAAIIQWYNGNPNAGGSIIALPQFAALTDLNDLWVQVTLDGCISDPVMIPLTFNDPPTITASSDVNSICNGGIVNLMANATDNSGVTWNNNGGDGSFGDPNMVNTSYTPGPLDIQNGSFTLTVTTTNNSNCPNASDDILINISAGPIADITGQDEICSNVSANLNAGSTDPTNNISWTTVIPSDGSFLPDNNNNTIYTPGPGDIANGSATVMVTVSDATGLCAANTDQFSINILPSPTALISITDPVVCEGEELFVSVTSANAANGLSWSSNGDGTFSDINNPNTFYTPGPVDGSNGSARLAVTVNSSNGCPPGTDFFDITVIDAPEVFANGSSTICSGSIVTLSASLNGSALGTSWMATPGDGSFSNPNFPNPVYVPGPLDLANGSITFTVTTIDPSGNCMPISDTHITTIETGATVMAGNDQDICAGNTVMLNAILSDPANTIAWTTSGDGNFNMNNVSNPFYTPGATDILNGLVILTATTESNNPNCTVNGTDEVEVTITPAPTVMVSDDQSICAGSLAPIEATIGGSATSFTWSTSGDGSFSNLSDPIATYTPGPNDLINQSVTITATTDNPNTACIPGTGMFQIFINDAPIVMLLGDQTICENETVDLNANLQAPATALTWSSTGDGSFFPINSPNATYTPGPNDLTNISTPIIITATTDDVNGTCPVGTADITVTLNAAPTLDLGSDLTSCENEDINLNSTILGGSATTIMWSTSGDGSFDNDQIINPTYNPSANDLTTGSVILSAVTDNGGGVCNTASDDITITFSTSGDASFSFPSIGCTNGNNPVPDISPSTSGSFSINNGGDIDAQTGEFLITSAILGTTYTITFTSTGNCPGDFTQDITIVGPDDPNFTYPTVSCSMGPNPIASNISGSPGNFTVDGGASILEPVLSLYSILLMQVLQQE